MRESKAEYICVTAMDARWLRRLDTISTRYGRATEELTRRSNEFESPARFAHETSDSTVRGVCH